MASTTTLKIVGDKGSPWVTPRWTLKGVLKKPPAFPPSAVAPSMSAGSGASWYPRHIPPGYKFTCTNPGWHMPYGGPLIWCGGLPPSCMSAVGAAYPREWRYLYQVPSGNHEKCHGSKLMRSAARWQLLLPGFTAAFIVIIFFSASTAAFLTKIIFWFSCWLVSFSGIGGNWTFSVINNFLTWRLKFLKKVVVISSSNITYCGSASILKRHLL